MKKSAFTMVEVIFVIVILGLLAMIAVPKFVATRDDAQLVTKAQNIATGASDVASYIVARGQVEDDITKMSSALSGIAKSGEGVVDTSDRSLKIKSGDEDECITIKIVTSGGDENLTLVNKESSDEKCNMLQKMIPESVYPIALRGTRVISD